MPLRDAPQASSNVCLPAIVYVADDQDWDDCPFVLITGMDRIYHVCLTNTGPFCVVQRR